MRGTVVRRGAAVSAMPRRAAVRGDLTIRTLAWPDGMVAALRPPREHPAGPWLVALGAGLWGTESAWRIPLNDVFSPNVLVFWEHVVLVLCALPFIVPRLGELRRVS